MKTLSNLVLILVALGVNPESSIAMDCDGAKIKKWMNDCDSVPGASILKCEARACHTALHRLLEEETIECYTSLELGPASDLEKYKVLDDFCHGEGPDPDDSPSPTPTRPPTSPPISSTTAPAPSSASTSRPSSTTGPSSPQSTSSESPSLTPSTDTPESSEALPQESQSSSTSLDAEEISDEASEDKDIGNSSTPDENKPATPAPSSDASTSTKIQVLAVVLLLSSISLILSC